MERMNEVLFIDEVTKIDFICRMIGGGCAMLVIVCGLAWSIYDTIKAIKRRCKNECCRFQQKETDGNREEGKGEGKEDL